VTSAGYSGRPLAQKLGVKEGTTVVLLDPPPGIEKALAPLPSGVTLRRGNRGIREMTIWFATSRRELRHRRDRRHLVGPAADPAAKLVGLTTSHRK
jgi:hypothetical protein